MDEYQETNREKSHKATKHKFWCRYCDACLVGDYGRCKVCGRKQTNKRK